MKVIYSMLRRTSGSILIPFMVLVLAGPAAGQVRDLNLGNFELRWDEGGSFFGEYQEPIGFWPAGWYRRANIECCCPWGAVTHLDIYKNEDNPDEGIEPYDRLAFQWGALGVAVEPIREVRRVKPPTVIVDGIPGRPYKGEVDPTLKTAQMIETVNKGPMELGGARFRLKIYAFDNPNYDDFFIFDYTIKSALDWDRKDLDPDGPDQTIEAWFGVHWNFQPCQYGRDEYERDFYNNDAWNGYMIRQSELVPPGSTPRDSLLISYACDSNDPMWEAWDDFGNPHRETGELLSPQYIGFCTLHMDKAVADQTDDPTQPINALTIDLDTELWCDVWPGGAVDVYDWMTTPARYESFIGDPWAPDPDITETELGRMNAQIHGPFEMAKGDSIHYVFAVGVGGIDPVYALELGKEWKAGNVSDAVKDSIVATGEDSLFHTLDKAKWAWINFEKTGDFGIPCPPPAPDIKVTSGPGCNYVEWGYPDPDMFKDPRTGVDDFTEWRVYHKQGHFLVHHPTDIPFQDYELIYSTTDRNDTSFTDTAVVRGQPYHYIVTAVDNEGLESSRFANRTLYAATPFKGGVSTVDSVHIVPNPYIISARVLNFAEPNKIAFFGLPPYCILRIYNETGDIVKVIEHTSGSADESWDQITESNQYLASGVYILSVQNAKDLEGNSLPSRNYKFVIIR